MSALSRLVVPGLAVAVSQLVADPTGTPAPPTDEQVFRLWGWILLGILAFWALLAAGILIYRKFRDDRRNREYYARLAAQGDVPTNDPVAALANDGRRYLHDADTDQEFAQTYTEQTETHLKLGPQV